ncbi:MAG: hypothetical protein LBM93_03340, partial [Oscillospiraceae bacterium]|nr:hypothetical protein [Oscillospiraceae bacterium]
KKRIWRKYWKRVIIIFLIFSVVPATLKFVIKFNELNKPENIYNANVGSYQNYAEQGFKRFKAGKVNAWDTEVIPNYFEKIEYMLMPDENSFMYVVKVGKKKAEGFVITQNDIQPEKYDTKKLGWDGAITFNKIADNVWTFEDKV